MNNHAFANAKTYRRSPFMRCLYNAGVFFKLNNLLNYFMAFKIEDFFRKAAISNDCAFGSSAFIADYNADKRIRIGRQCVIRGILRADSGGEISVGDNTYVGDDGIISARSTIAIGSNVLIAHGVQIFDNTSHPQDHVERAAHYLAILKGGDLHSFDSCIAKNPITIKDHVWIGFNSIILSGVTVGKGAVIGAGAVVTEDVPDFCLVAGNPAKIIKKLEKEN